MMSYHSPQKTVLVASVAHTHEHSDRIQFHVSDLIWAQRVKNENAAGKHPKTAEIQKSGPQDSLSFCAYFADLKKKYKEMFHWGKVIRVMVFFN